MRKHPIQVHLDAALIAWLRTEAAQRGLSISEVVRRAIRRLIESGGA